MVKRLSFMRIKDNISNYELLHQSWNHKKIEATRRCYALCCSNQLTNQIIMKVLSDYLTSDDSEVIVINLRSPSHLGF